MSIYMQAVQSGVSSLALAMSGSNAETEEARIGAYNAQSRRIASSNARSAAEKNISAIAQDKILTNVNIRLQQSQAEAMQSLQAAFSGSEGGSIEDTVYVTQSGAENLIASNNRQAKQATEQQKSQVSGAHAAMLSVEDKKISTSDAVIGSLGSFELNDLKIAKDIKDAGGISKLWSD